LLSLVGTTTHQNHNTILPRIFLDQLWELGGTAVIYKSSSAKLVVKFSLIDQEETLGSEWRLLAENQVYEYLKGKGLSFIPQYYGLYTWPGSVTLVISDEGKSLADTQTSFKGLSWWTRYESMLIYSPDTQGLQEAVVCINVQVASTECLSWGF